MQTEIVKDSGYDSTDTENTLYDGCENSLKKNKSNVSTSTSPQNPSIELTSSTSHESDNADVFVKYNLETLKEELLISEKKKFQLRLKRNKLDYILSPIFYFVLLAIHAYYVLYLYTTKFINEKKDKLAMKKLQITPKTLSMNVSYLKKIPKHLSFVIQIQPSDQQDPSHLFHNIKQLIYWSMEVGIENISFYDYHGFLKQHVHDIVNNFEEKVNFLAAPNLTIQFSCSGERVSVVSLSNTYILNNNEKQKVLFENFKVNFISYEDGKPHLVKIVNLLSNTMKTSDIEKMSIEDMDQFILKHSGEMIKSTTDRDPELIIIYGGTTEYFKLYGYPPWNIRLSEIYYVPGKTDITYSGFINGLFRYSRCEQRVGK